MATSKPANVWSRLAILNFDTKLSSRETTPTLLPLFGLPIAEDMDGKPLVDALEQKPEIEWIASWEDVEGNDGRHPKDMVIDAADSEAALDQLVALGYIDRPDQDASKAIADSQRELDYNLSRAYMDEDKHGEAIPLLEKLYLENPLEFRFGVQLANCLRATARNVDLKALIEDLEGRWLVAAGAAREKLRDIAKLARERKAVWKKLKKLDDENTDENAVPLAMVTRQDKPKLFEENELKVIQNLRGIIRGNPQTLSFLGATVAAAEGDFQHALELLESAKLTKSGNPGFQFQLGNVYLGLEQYDDAKATFRRGLELDEYHPNCLMGLCRTYIDSGKVKKALEFGKRAIGLKYQFPVAHYFYARAKANQEVIQETAGTIKFPPLGDLDFSKMLPAMPEEEFAKLGILPRLSNALRLESIESRLEKQEVIVVSGLPRSGTSMMMQMLASGGMEIYTDVKRKADENNLRGYLEADVVKSMASDNTWVKDCRGQVIKVVAPVVPYLPQEERYRVVFMQRDIKEIVSSQNRMLGRLDEKGGDIEEERLRELSLQQALSANRLILGHRNALLPVSYASALENPEKVARQVAEFLGMELDISAMVAAVDPSLHREKA